MSESGITVADALLRYPELSDLVLVQDAGWGFRLLVDPDGALVGLVGTRHVRRYTNALWIYSYTEVIALRVLAEEFGGGGTVWKYDRGGLTAAVQELLALPEPGERFALSLVRVSSGLWVP
ncbi:hypothetical protein [Actinokineospora diospyrosa]|uniref:Uncharacterized protein n=1 Tax=Actinokineospora diospyrosa TaxID=103728 RepID=A0ABT1I9R3_9PSEU|nr:hypothetical protein [Actinokineospora diospyrosa]MCP2269298.1 hypothetical protein [Actinokineospora diospyrosa]